ncbi:enoyl-CoA hydratase [Gynuella sunshinyii]|uniref:Enoyl-CoA hydratase/carnithine racemase n=1 Tax=Gynuella sunshinyii YC6258 TaxID=1445510 RepID=A0A0C5VBA3_9GAMM|nr:enoyl-CoA hydratase [Gynuella sunshinyii]AJQ96625.1 enoyl-CoA hydratase/carnithine racemase [Gynuella sunshinyii YC6258]
MSHIHITRQETLLEIELNRPEKRNALTTAMYQQLTDALIEAKQDDGIHVVLLNGQPFCFTAGNDLTDFLEQSDLNTDAPVFQFLRTVTEFPKPLICAVNGPAVGIGTTICLHADLVYCGESAEFQLPFVKLGLVPEFASTYLLPAMLGHVKAFELLVLGEAFDAETARQLGIVNAVFGDEHYLTAAKQKAMKLAKLPVEAVKQSKALLKHQFIHQALEAIEREGELFSRRLQSEEVRQILASFFTQKS